MSTTAYPLLYAAAVLAMCVGVPAVFAVLAWLILGRSPARLRRRLSRRRSGPPVATPAVFHQLELTRLTHTMQECRASRAPGAALRLRAATAAYDDRLVDLALAVGLPVPDHRPPLADHERFDVETRLVEAGAHW